MSSALREMAWQDDAACRGMPMDAFFPLSGVVPDAAQRACSHCPVRVRCAEYGMQPTHGVWGGTFRGRPASVEGGSAKPPVPEALQALLSRTYSSRGTANTTTTTPRKAPAMTAKTTAPKANKTAPAAAPTPAPVPTPAASEGSRSKSAVSKDGSHICPSCTAEKPVTKFPTARTAEGTYDRDLSECRECRDARRAARKAEREAAKATAA